MTCFHSNSIFLILFVLSLLRYLVCYPTSCPTELCNLEWSLDQIPIPQTESGQCGSVCKNTWICDPCKTMDNFTLEEISKEIGPRKIYWSSEEYIIIIMIINKMKVQPVNRGIDINVFSENIRDKLKAKIGKNGNEVIIFLSTSETQISTSVGGKASEILTSKCRQHVSDMAMSYFVKGQFGAGLMSMITKYNYAFQVGVCDVPLDGYLLIFPSVICFIIVVPFIILCIRAIMHTRRKGKHFCTDCTRDIEGLVLDNKLIIIRMKENHEKKDDDVKDLEKGNKVDEIEVSYKNEENADNMEYNEASESDSESEDEGIFMELPFNKWLRLK